MASAKMKTPDILSLGRQSNALSTALEHCRTAFIAVGAFSLVVNILQLTTSIYMLQVYDRVLSSRSTDTLFFLTLITVFALMLLATMEMARTQVMQRAGAWVEQKLAPEGFVRGIEGQLQGRGYRMEILRDLGVVRGFLSSPTLMSIYDVPWVPVYLAVIFLLHPVLGVVATLGAVALVILTVVNETATTSLLKRTSLRGAVAQRQSESIVRNAEVIDAMGMMPAVLERWHVASVAVGPDQKAASDRASAIMAATRFIRMLLQVAVLGVGALLVLRNEMTSGAMIAASIIMGRALAPVEQLIGGWKVLVSARSARQRLTMGLLVPRMRPAGLPLPAPEGKLTVDRVSYAFPGQKNFTIKAVSFGLEAGESLAVIGPSAAGKTTLIRLLIGAVDPSGGCVRLDGADIYTWQREDVGRYIGYMPQDVELFDGTVFDNIARMQPDASPNDVFDAAKLAGCHDMILRLPEGYETAIGEAGSHLSGGQRQMIGLARAMFGNPKLVVLDEPNSNLDSEGEAALMAAMLTLKERKATVVVVSHRPTLVQRVDTILVLRDGALDMYGPRPEIMKRLMGPRTAEAPPPPRPGSEGFGSGSNDSRKAAP